MIKVTGKLLLEIKEKYKTGLSISELSRIYNIDSKTISKHFKRNGIVIEHRQTMKSIIVENYNYVSIEDRNNEIIKQYNSGRGALLIARSLLIGKRTVFRILRDNNVKTDKNRRPYNLLTKDIDINYIKNSYISGHKTLDIAKKLNVSDHIIRKILSDNNISIRRPADVMSTITIDLYDIIKKWYINDELSSYEIKDRLYAERNITKSYQSIQHFLKRHGITRSISEQRRLVANKLSRKEYRTRPERNVETILKQLGLTYEWQFAIDAWTFDFKVGNVLIEVNGDRWHSMPQRCQRDTKKNMVAINNKYIVCYIWEHEINSNLNLVTNRIKSYCLPKPNFNFKNCDIKIVEWDKIKLFLDTYHYQASGRSGVMNVAATHNNEIIAAIVFAYPVRQEIAMKQNVAYNKILELTRLCISPDFQSYNFATWFLARSRRLIKDIDILVAFSDPNFGHSGTIYKADNWMYNGQTSASYWYTTNKSKIVHKKAVWNRAIKNDISEEQQAINDNLRKISARPKLRFIKYLK